MDASTTTLFDVPSPRTIATYNLKNGNDLFHWIRRAPSLARTIREINPTLMGTQEGNLSQLEYIREQVPHLQYIGRGRMADGTDETMGIFYDERIVTPLESGHFWLSPTPDEPGSMMPGEDLPRMATWLRCTIAEYDRPLLMVNTHLTHTGISTDAQVEVLVGRINLLVRDGEDTVLTGDFNQHRLTDAWQAITASGFVDAFDFVTEYDGPQFTFPDWDAVPTPEAEISRPLTDRIDWIFYRPADGHDLPRHTRLHTINTHREGEIPSDHFPVLLSNQ